jgi:hypothetical protein
MALALRELAAALAAAPLAAARPPVAGPRLIPCSRLGLAEPSGVAFHADLDRLCVVGDRGVIAELDAGGRLLRRAVVGGDFEDATVHSPSCCSSRSARRSSCASTPGGSPWWAEDASTRRRCWATRWTAACDPRPWAATWRSTAGVASLLVLGRKGAPRAEQGERPQGAATQAPAAANALGTDSLCLDTRGTLWIADDRLGLWRWEGGLARLRAALR